EVACGHHRPPRYCHPSQRSGAITATDHGIEGLMARLLTISAVQTPWPTNAMRNAKSVAQATTRMLRRMERISITDSARAPKMQECYTGRRCVCRAAILLDLRQPLTGALPRATSPGKERPESRFPGA